MRAILAWSLIGIPSVLGIFGFNHWPFSAYEMYSSNPRRLIKHEIMGSTSDGRKSVLRDARLLWPMGAAWLSYRLRIIMNQPQREQILRDILHYYCRRTASQYVLLSIVTYQDDGRPLVLYEVKCD